MAQLSQTWERCRVLFEPLDGKFSPETVTKLLRLDDDYDVEGNRSIIAARSNIITLEDRLRQSIHATHGIEDENDVFAHFEKITAFLVWVKSEIQLARDASARGVTFYRTGVDFQCIVMINTLIHDRWYEIGKTASAIKRERGYAYAGLLWTLVMEYRYWKRRAIIEHEDFRVSLANNVEVSPAFLPTAYFRKELDGICQVPEGLDQVPVMKWFPERVFLAMQRISAHRVHVLLPTAEKQQTIKMYINALLDRLCIIARGTEKGPLDKLATMNPDWFVLAGEKVRERDIGSSDIRTIQHEIKVIRDKEHGEAKKHSVYKIADKMIAKEKRGDMKSVITAYEKGAEELTQMKARKKIVESLMKDVAPYDITVEQEMGMAELDAEIKRMEAEMIGQQQKLKEKLEEEDRQRNGGVVDQGKIGDILHEMKILIGGTTHDDVADTDRDAGAMDAQSYGKDYVPTINWARDNMILSMHLITRHSKARGMNMRTLTSTGTKLRHRIRDEIFRSISFANERDCITDAEMFIIENIETQSWEREYYRNSSSKKVVFKSMDAWRNSRGDGRAEIRLDGFENVNIAYILDPANRHPHRMEVIGYTLYWWLKQKYSAFNPDWLFYLWELENEFLNLNRKRISTPCMGRIGGEWVVFLGGNWEDAEDQWANVIWCGDDAIACFVEFLSYVEKDGWRLTYRDPNGHKVCSIEHTIIWDLTRGLFLDQT